MIYATILTLCFIGNTCDDYVVDTASTQDDCYTNLISDNQKMAVAWGPFVPRISPGNTKAMREFLDEHKLYSVNPNQLIDYDYTCQVIADNQIP